MGLCFCKWATGASRQIAPSYLLPSLESHNTCRVSGLDDSLLFEVVLLRPVTAPDGRILRRLRHHLLNIGGKGIPRFHVDHDVVPGNATRG